MGTEPVLVTLGPARFGVGQVRAGQAGNENLRLADDTLVDDAQRHAGVIDFERLAGAMPPAHRRRPGVSLPGMEMRAELGVAVALRMHGSDIPATAAVVSRRGHAAPSPSMEAWG